MLPCPKTFRQRFGRGSLSPNGISQNLALASAEFRLVHGNGPCVGSPSTGIPNRSKDLGFTWSTILRKEACTFGSLHSFESADEWRRGANFRRVILSCSDKNCTPFTRRIGHSDFHFQCTTFEIHGRTVVNARVQGRAELFTLKMHVLISNSRSLTVSSSWSMTAKHSNSWWMSFRHFLTCRHVDLHRTRHPAMPWCCAAQ